MGSGTAAAMSQEGQDPVKSKDEGTRDHSGPLESLSKSQREEGVFNGI